MCMLIPVLVRVSPIVLVGTSLSRQRKRNHALTNVLLGKIEAMVRTREEIFRNNRGRDFYNQSF